MGPSSALPKHFSDFICVALFQNHAAGDGVEKSIPNFVLFDLCVKIRGRVGEMS